MDVHEKRLIVCNKLLDVLSNTSESGYIAGWETDEEISCVAASQCTKYFLTGLDVLGIYCLINNGSLSEDELISNCQEHLNVLQVELANPVVLFVSKDNDSANLIAKVFNTYYGSFHDISTTYASHNPAVLLRAKGKMPLLFETASDADAMKENIEWAIEKLRVTVENQVSAYLLQDSSLILTHLQDEKDTFITCGNLSKYVQNPDLAEEIKKNKKKLKKKVPINFSILIQTTGDAALENTVNHCLVIHCQRRDFRSVFLDLPLDVIVVCLESSNAYAIYNHFVKAIRQQLEKMQECLLSYAKNMEFACPVPYHFYPDTWSLPFTVIYPSNKTDAELESHRRSLHSLLLLPLDRPMLKRLNRYEFGENSSGYLVNPHEGLHPSGVVDGKVSLVHGRYSYHHYMQDRVNDNGWGCAYRSLQTIVSWFKFQGYTERNIPMHREIQQALVDIGDKPKTFVGSKNWIGSQEVGFCLDHFLQVESRIMCVESGLEMGNKGRELFLHFRDQGTPVMIGGGVLAHTILGVDFNEKTGALKFLILDPHYTGGEDLHTIQSKGWCGWKGVNFWDQSVFYNLCLPQRPLKI